MTKRIVPLILIGLFERVFIVDSEEIFAFVEFDVEGVSQDVE